VDGVQFGCHIRIPDSVESAAKIGRSQDRDKCEIAPLKLAGTAKQFYQGCTELHCEDATWQTFKTAFGRRYEDVHTDQFHFTRLETAKQGKKETPQEFEDRCRGLAQKGMGKSNDPQTRCVHRGVVDRMLLASFVLSLTGAPGREFRFLNLQTICDSLKIAPSAQEAERQERFNETSYTKFDESVRVDCHPVQHAPETGVRSRQRVRERINTCIVGKIGLRLAYAGQQMATLGTTTVKYRVGQKQLDDLNSAPCQHLCRWRDETHIAG
jgi:hypothetical protein